MKSSDFRTKARKQLSGRWSSCVLLTLVYFAFSFILNFIQNNIQENSFAYLILSIFIFVINIPLAYGFTKATLNIYNEEECSPFSFFSFGFSNFLRAWKLCFKTFLKLLVPIILLIASLFLIFFGISSSVVSSLIANSLSSMTLALILFGIILYVVSIIYLAMKSYYYALAIIIAADDETISETDALEKSYNLMKGNRGKLFALQISFIGWAILALFTFGIGYLWLIPYIQFSIIAFYKSFLDNTEKEEIVESTDNN